MCTLNPVHANCAPEATVSDVTTQGQLVTNRFRTQTVRMRTTPTGTNGVSVKLRLARPYWNKPVISRPNRCGSRIGAKRNRHTLNFLARDRSEVHNS